MRDKKIGLRFRKQLKTQLPLLESEGLLSAEQKNAIAQRYRLDHLAGEATAKLLMIIYLIGVFLIGIGIISFVAYHWNAIGKTLKLALIFSAMLASHLSGFYLWKISAKSPKLGHALVCLGTLIFGANIGLIAQIFHIKSQWNTGFLPWAVGAAVMAYAVSSVPNAMIAIVTSFIWFIGQLDWSAAKEPLWYPFAVVIVFGGFAWKNRSVLTYTLTLITIGVSLPITLSLDKGDMVGGIYGMSICGLLFYCWGLIACHRDNYEGFALSGIIIGILSMTIAIYLVSFLALSEAMATEEITRFFLSKPSIIASAIAAATITVLMIPPAIKQIRNDTILKVLTIPMVAALPVLTGLGLVDHFALTAAGNLLGFGLAAIFVWAANQLEDRRLFWVGVLLAAILIVSRSIEYETGLLMKSMVFIASGAGVIIAGVMFEKQLKIRRSANE